MLLRNGAGTGGTGKGSATGQVVGGAGGRQKAAFANNCNLRCKAGRKANKCDEQTKSFKETGRRRQAPSVAQVEGPNRQALFASEQSRSEPLRAPGWLITMKELNGEHGPRGNVASLTVVAGSSCACWSKCSNAMLEGLVVLTAKQGPKRSKAETHVKRDEWPVKPNAKLNGLEVHEDGGIGIQSPNDRSKVTAVDGNIGEATDLACDGSRVPDVPGTICLRDPESGEFMTLVHEDVDTHGLRASASRLIQEHQIASSLPASANTFYHQIGWIICALDLLVIKLLLCRLLLNPEMIGVQMMAFINPSSGYCTKGC